MATVNDIIHAFNKHQEQMIKIDLNPRLSSNGKVKYFDIKLKKADNTLAPLKIKFFKQEICNKVKNPFERDYEQIKICIKKPNEFTQAMSLICDSYTHVMNDLISKGIIATSGGEIDVPSLKINTPMQKSTTANGQRIEFKDPLFWVIPACKRYSESELESLDRLNARYKSDGNPFIVKEFDFKIYNLDNLDADNTPQEFKVNNSNIHKVIPKGSLVSGIINMQIIASAKSLSLNTKISEKLYVKTADDLFSKDDITEMLA
jgi:hypothetical protein